MKRAVVFMALGGFALAGLGLGLQNLNPAQSAELDGFAINTQEKAVTVTLFTDQRVPFTTEQHGKQYTIVLPNTQLSEQQMNNGLPVVIDNKNRFIGRAVPTDDGKVKIILPNLPASEYAVSIQQKRNNQAVATAESAPAIKPRPAITKPVSNRFEQVAAQFTKPAHSTPVAKASSTHHDASNQAPLQLSTVPSVGTNFRPSSSGSIWNPYVVKRSSTHASGQTARTKQHPVAESSTRAVPNAAQQPTEAPIKTISIAESLQSQQANTLPQNSSANPSSDPLWYLHSLPPAANLPADSLTGPATQAQGLPLVLNPAPAAEAKPAAPVIVRRSISASIKEAFSSIPKWLLITLGIFLSGIGIFTFIGGLVLLRVLFSQTRQQFSAQPVLAYHPNLNLYTTLPEHQAQIAEAIAYASNPKTLSAVTFQDKASFSALDYLKESPGNISQAVHNTTLVKFPSGKRHRSSSKKRINSQTGSTPIYSYNS